MKYFICGYKGLDKLPEDTKKYLSALRTQGHEFFVRKIDISDELIQTCLTEIGSKNVTVYSLEDVPDSIPDEWSTKVVERRMKGNYRPFCHFDDRDLIISEDADSGIMIWDRTDISVFLNILNLVFQNKPVDIFLTNDSSVFKADSVESFCSLLPEKVSEYTSTWESVPERLYRKAVASVVESEVLRQCLLNYPIEKYSLLDVILHSPVSIQLKADLLKELSVTDDLFHEVIDSLDEEVERKKRGEIVNCANAVESVYHSVSQNIFTAHYENYRKGIEELELKPGEYFYLRRINNIGCEEGIAAFSNLESALKYIRFYVRNWKKTTESWLVLEKWQKKPESDNGGWLKNLYTYLLYLDEIIDVSINMPRFDGLTTFGNGYLGEIGFGIGMFMHFPTPFDAGDIVKIDCTPFGSVAYAIVLEKAGAEGFSNGLHIRVLEYDGEWKISWLDASRTSGKIKGPKLSPLYRISKLEGELTGNYSKYKIITELIGNDEEKAEKLLKALLDKEDEYDDGCNEDEFIKLVKEIFPEYELPVEINPDDDIIITECEYIKKQKIRFSDIHDPEDGYVWKYDWKNTEINVIRENDCAVILSVRTKDKSDGLVVALDKEDRQPIYAAKADGCIDVTGVNGWYLALCEVIRPDNTKKLRIYDFCGTLDPYFTCDNVLRREEPFDLKEWDEAHLEIEDNKLFVVVDGKRYLYVHDLNERKYVKIKDLKEDKENGD